MLDLILVYSQIYTLFFLYLRKTLVGFGLEPVTDIFSVIIDNWKKIGRYFDTNGFTLLANTIQYNRTNQ